MLFIIPKLHCCDSIRCLLKRRQSNDVSFSFYFARHHLAIFRRVMNDRNEDYPLLV